LIRGTDGKAAVLTHAEIREVHRDAWARTLSTRPLLDAEIDSHGCAIRWFKNTQSDIVQPPLKDNYVVLHLGGPKRVRRAADGPSVVADLEDDAISIIPACAAYDWSTEGPIEYAHIYIPPYRLARATESIFDRDGAQVRLQSKVGQPDQVLVNIFRTLMESARNERRADLFLDVMTEAFLAQLLRGHANLSGDLRPRQHALAPKRLKAVTAYVDEHLDAELTLDTLAAIARLSRYHFTRAFARATGQTPHAFVMARRLERAKILLRTTPLSISEIAVRCGFAGAAHLSNRLFEREGLRPSTFRQIR